MLDDWDFGVPSLYLYRSRLDEADPDNILHDLRIVLEGVHEGMTGFGNRALLPLLLQVIHKDIIIILPVHKPGLSKEWQAFEQTAVDWKSQKHTGWKIKWTKVKLKKAKGGGFSHYPVYHNWIHNYRNYFNCVHPFFDGKRVNCPVSLNNHQGILVKKER